MGIRDHGSPSLGLCLIIVVWMSEIREARRAHLSLGEQAKAVRRLRTGERAKQIMRVYRIGRGVVTKANKNGDKIPWRMKRGSKITIF